MIFKRSFRAIGIARKRVAGDCRQEWFFWCLGSALFANVVTHFGINYMVHLSVYFFILLVCISVATSQAKREAAQAKVRVEEAPAELEFVSALDAEAACFPLNGPRQGTLQRLLGA